MKKVFFGKVENGKMRLYRHDEFVRVVKGLDGNEIAVAIGKRTKERSDAENRYYWGVVVEGVGRAMGEVDENGNVNKDVVHEYLKSKFAKEVLIVNVPGGVEFVDTVRSTATMKTTEFENYLSRIRTWASVYLETYIPTPNEVDLNTY